MKKVISILAMCSVTSVFAGSASPNGAYIDPSKKLSKVQISELIARECMVTYGAIHETSGHVRGKNDALGLGAEKCKVLIKKHFGVK